MRQCGYRLEHVTADFTDFWVASIALAWTRQRGPCYVSGPELKVVQKAPYPWARDTRLNY